MRPRRCVGGVRLELAALVRVFPERAARRIGGAIASSGSTRAAAALLGVHLRTLERYLVRLGPSGRERVWAEALAASRRAA